MRANCCWTPGLLRRYAHRNGANWGDRHAACCACARARRVCRIRGSGGNFAGLRFLQAQGRADLPEETRRPRALCRVSSAEQQRVPAGEAARACVVLERGAVEEEFRRGLDARRAGRSRAKPIAAPAACAAGGRQRLSLGRLAVRLEERPRLENARSVGEGAEEVGWVEPRSGETHRWVSPL